MWIFGMIVTGLIVGVIAKAIMPGKDPGGFFITVLLGIVGSVVAGWLGRAIGWYETGEPAGWIASIVGAVIVLAIYRAFSHRDAGGTGYRRAA
jgi:uncharacterized membrane protein YeaQ/YmgE (transglycosylase-associated protein family)